MCHHWMFWIECTTWYWELTLSNGGDLERGGVRCFTRGRKTRYVTRICLVTWKWGHRGRRGQSRYSTIDLGTRMKHRIWRRGGRMKVWRSPTCSHGGHHHHHFDACLYPSDKEKECIGMDLGSRKAGEKYWRGTIIRQCIKILFPKNTYPLTEKMDHLIKYLPFKHWNPSSNLHNPYKIQVPRGTLFWDPWTGAWLEVEAVESMGLAG